MSDTPASRIIPGASSSTVAELLEMYNRTQQLQKNAETVLNKVISETPEIEALVDRLKNLERAQMELYIAQATKNNPVDIGEESYLSTWDSFRGKTVTQLAVDRAATKRKARRLLQYYHPDRATGNAETFDLIRKAVQAADIELVHVYDARTFDDYPENQMRDLKTRLEIRNAQTMGHPFFKFAQLYYSGNVEQLKAELVNKLTDRIDLVARTNLGA